MKVKNSQLATSAVKKSQYPEEKLPQIALFGRSNAGKSSMINTIIQRKNLARTSSAPGKTRLVNFYRINGATDDGTQELTWYFVDLPGYGFAKANENVKAQWGKMIEDYLHKSKQLRTVFLLIDIRHDPSENDRIMYDWICKMGYQPVIIATKLDKINRSQIQKQLKTIRTVLKCKPGTVMIPFSATTKQGREEIYDYLDQLLAEKTENETEPQE